MKKLLVVEDEEGARQVLCRLLQSHGYEVVEAEDGPGAVSAFKDNKDVSMVISDLTLPSMTGWEVARAIKDDKPDVPVVILSGWDINNEDENIKSSGVLKVLSKPVKVKELVGFIKEILGA